MANVESQSRSDGLTQEDAEILAETHRIFGNAQRGLTVDEIAEMLYLQKSSVRSYLSIEKRRIDLYRRLFVEDGAIKERANRILESRRARYMEKTVKSLPPTREPVGRV